MEHGFDQLEDKVRKAAELVFEMTKLAPYSDEDEKHQAIAAKEAGAATLRYGMFLQTIYIDFIIIAFAVFLLVKAVNKAKKKEEAAPAAPPAPSKQEVLLGEIRDLLKARG